MNPLKFALFLAFCALPAHAGLTLIGGSPADPAKWPASVYASMGSSRCTATVVGEKVLLIASHCVSNGGTANFKAAGVQYSSKCTHHPEYRGNSTADWAICAVSKKVEGIAYENMNTDESRYRVGDELTLTGYGCVNPGGSGGNDGVYRVGSAPIQSLPKGKNYDITTKGSSALCYGDSGGPVFKIEGTKRWVVGVNSRGDISKWSYLPAVAVPTAQAFFRDWAQTNNVKICGIHQDAVGCRDSAPTPPPLPIAFRMENKNGTVKLKVEIRAGSTITEARAREVLKTRLDKME